MWEPEHNLGNIPLKWKYVPRKRLIFSRTTVTNEDVEDIVEWAIDAIEKDPTTSMPQFYRVWSGVHGVPGGNIQIDDEEFFKTDRQDLAVKYPHYHVTVHQMDVLPLPPNEMLMHLEDKNSTVILAWCYSEGFIYLAPADLAT